MTERVDPMPTGELEAPSGAPTAEADVEGHGIRYKGLEQETQPSEVVDGGGEGFSRR